MALELLSFLFVGLRTANALGSTVTVALGAFVVTSPDKAAKIWGSQRFDNLAPEGRDSFIGWYRIFGIFLLQGGVLLAVDSVLFSNYHD
jgi:membrane protein YqaA with SNARE-associated domain